jgi:trafficking protein particle complex subunit 1
MIYCFYLFNRDGVCLYYEDWNRVRKPKSLPEEQKLIFGLLFSLKATVLAMSPRQPTEGLHSYCTATYKLNYFETMTGLKFVLITDPTVPSLRYENTPCVQGYQLHADIHREYTGCLCAGNV